MDQFPMIHHSFNLYKSHFLKNICSANEKYKIILTETQFEKWICLGLKEENKH